MNYQCYLCLATRSWKPCRSELYCVYRSLIGLILITAHLYLSFIRNLSLKVRAKGCTGPAPISRMVIDRLLTALLYRWSSNLRSCSLVFDSIQPISPLRLMLGLIGTSSLSEQCKQIGTLRHAPMILSSSKGYFNSMFSVSLLHESHYQSNRDPLG